MSKPVDNIRDTLAAENAPRSEDSMWRLIAAAHSPDWSSAERKLRIAEQLYQEDEPLGPIGKALGDNGAEESYHLAYAAFAIEDEKIRSRPDLQDLHRTLMQEQEDKPVSRFIPAKEPRRLRAEFSNAHGSVDMYRVVNHVLSSILRPYVAQPAPTLAASPAASTKQDHAPKAKVAAPALTPHK